MQHHIIYIPGLHDQHLLNRTLSKLLPLFWRPLGFRIHVMAPDWEQGGKLEPKLKLITGKIDELINAGHIVSVIGQSAGGSLALNAFAAKKNKINAVVNVCGRLRAGGNVNPSLEKAARHSPAFKQSVLLFEHENEPKLTAKDRGKILTLKPIWDETVPGSTVGIKGARNVTLPLFEHTLSGAIIVSFLSPVISKFLRGR